MFLGGDGSRWARTGERYLAPEYCILRRDIPHFAALSSLRLHSWHRLHRETDACVAQKSIERLPGEDPSREVFSPGVHNDTTENSVFTTIHFLPIGGVLLQYRYKGISF